MTFKGNSRTSHTQSTLNLGLHRLIQNGGHEDLLRLFLNQIRNICRSATLRGNILQSLTKIISRGYFLHNIIDDRIYNDSFYNFLNRRLILHALCAFL